MIAVRQTTSFDPLAFEVTVRDSGGETHHEVTMTRAYCNRLKRGAHSPDRCIEAAFRFLLDREPKEAIPSRFDVSVIGRYFPAFENELPRYLEGPGLAPE